MTTANAQKKLRNLEAQVEALKRALVGAPDAAVDAAHWARVSRATRQSRKATFRKQYGKTTSLP